MIHLQIYLVISYNCLLPAHLEGSNFIPSYMSRIAVLCSVAANYNS